MRPNREPSEWSPDAARTTTRRQALAVVGGVSASALAGCLGLGASGESSNSSGGAQGSDSLSAPVQGDPKASVSVVVYEDFACPHCQTYNLSVLPKLESKYIESGDIRYEHRDFPVVSDESWRAASGARAVQDRAGDDSFFTYARLLYENQSSLGPDTYASLANQMNLDGQAISDAAESQSYETTVRSDYDRASNNGISGTPTILVDGSAVEATVSAISSAIDSAK